METHIALISVFLSLVTLAITLLRKQSFVTANLQAELDLAVEANKRLLEELAEKSDALHAASVKIRPEVLAQYAKQAVAYSEQLGGTAKEKLARAVEAAQRLDAGDNGKRDWSDAQIRIAIESEVALLGK